MGNALLIQFPDRGSSAPSSPSSPRSRRPSGWSRSSTRRWTDRSTPLVFTTAAVDTVRPELARTRAPVIDFFDIHMSRVEEVLGRRGLHEAARLHGVGRHPQLQQPDGGGGVHHRARRRPERARPGEGRCHPHRAVAVRQDADEHVPRPPARPVRRQLPAGRRGPRAADLPGLLARPRVALRRPHHDRRAAQPGPQRAPAGLALRLGRAVPLGAAPGRRALRRAPRSRSSTPRRARSRRWPP